MEAVLRNLAHIELCSFCKANGLPCNGHKGEGAHTVKAGRGFNYSLVSSTTGTAIATVRFSKNRVPEFVKA